MTATDQVRILERMASVRPLDRDEARSLHEASIMAEMESPALERQKALDNLAAAAWSALRERHFGVPMWLWVVVVTQAIGAVLVLTGLTPA